MFSKVFDPNTIFNFVHFAKIWRGTVETIFVLVFIKFIVSWANTENQSSNGLGSSTQRRTRHIVFNGANTYLWKVKMSYLHNRNESHNTCVYSRCHDEIKDE